MAEIKWFDRISVDDNGDQLCVESHQQKMQCNVFVNIRKEVEMKTELVDDDDGKTTTCRLEHDFDEDMPRFGDLGWNTS